MKELTCGTSLNPSNPSSVMIFMQKFIKWNLRIFTIRIFTKITTSVNISSRVSGEKFMFGKISIGGMSFGEV